MKTRSQILGCFAVFAVFTGGCVISPTSGDDARNARLPIGVTLLDTDRGICAGPVAIDESSIRSTQRSDLVIQRGENATFQVDPYGDDDVDIEWTCVGSTSTVEAGTECPYDTSHVRITRELTGNEFLVECYGGRAYRR